MFQFINQSIQQARRSNYNMSFSANQLKIACKNVYKSKSKQQIERSRQHQIQGKNQFYSFANKSQIEYQNYFGDQTKNYSLIRPKLNTTRNIGDVSFNGSIDILNFSKQLSQFVDLKKEPNNKKKASFGSSPIFCDYESPYSKILRNSKLLLFMVYGLRKQKKQLELDISKFVESQSNQIKNLVNKLKKLQLRHEDQLMRIKLQKQKLYNQNQKLLKLLRQNQNQFENLKNSIIDQNQKNELLQKLLTQKVGEKNNSLDQLIAVKKQLLKQTQLNRQLMIDNINLKQNIAQTQHNFKKLERQQSQIIRNNQFEYKIKSKYGLKESSQTQKATLFDSRQTIKLKNIQRQSISSKLNDYSNQEVPYNKFIAKQNKLHNTLIRVKSMRLSIQNDEPFSPSQKQKYSIQKIQEQSFFLLDNENNNQV